MAELLRKVNFFKDLDEATLNRFASISTAQNFQHGETIMLAGDTRRIIFFIARGQAKVFSDSKNSRNSILSLLATSDFFGEIQLFSENAKSHFSVKAEGECSVIFFKGKDFINEITSTPKLLVTFLKATTRKLGKTYMQIESLSMSTIRGRIRSCLMQFIEEAGGKSRPTQQQIAAMCGTTRETVNRELSFLAKNGYIKLDGKNLVLLKDLNE
jgi:CRP-like cAMP-binding protein